MALPVLTTVPPVRLAVSDAALSGPRAAALESSGASNAMKAATSETWRSRRADVGSSHPAGMEGPDARKIWEGTRAEADSCGPAAGKPGEEGRGAGVETRRRMNAGCARLTKPWTTADGGSAEIDGVSHLGMHNDDAVVMIAPDRRANDCGDGAAPKTVVPLIAARVIAGAVRAVVVPAIAVVLNCLRR